MNPETRKKLAAHLKLAENCSDEEMDKAVNAMVDAAAQQAAAAEEAKKAEETKAANDALASAKAAREARVEQAFDILISQGRMSKADADAKRPELLAAANEGDVTTALETLRKGPVKYDANGKLLSADLGGSNKQVLAANDAAAKGRERNDKFLACLSELTAGGPATSAHREAAWNLARSRHPDLFA